MLLTAIDTATLYGKPNAQLTSGHTFTIHSESLVMAASSSIFTPDSPTTKPYDASRVFLATHI